ncbi:Uncharacterized protein APZ42_022139 [Daphnia magna]|uniref:Uncharacterized protein n=1 Tax=Daphnia magna TaxID=35525 RepID=A0A164W1N9_9CRUS|nr:Uncharacterized protein APZ42_022139 [Daphnia magna]
MPLEMALLDSIRRVGIVAQFPAPDGYHYTFVTRGKCSAKELLFVLFTRAAEINRRSIDEKISSYRTASHSKSLTNFSLLIFLCLPF